MPKKPHLKAVSEALVKKLGIGKSRIYEMAKQIADGVQVSTEKGIYLLAAKNGINLTKYLHTDEVREIRELHLKSNQQMQSPPPSSPAKKEVSSKPRIINIGQQFTLTDPILPNKILKEAEEMSKDVYPLLYVLENSIRELILRVMRIKHGNNWWDTKVPKDIRDEVQKRKEKENENPWHGRRGAHEIYYTDISWLGRIVQNNWQNFKDILPSITWLTQRLDDITHSRNPVAHMNPLSKHDIARIKVYFGDWQRQVDAKLSKIPSS